MAIPRIPNDGMAIVFFQLCVMLESQIFHLFPYVSIMIFYVHVLHRIGLSEILQETSIFNGKNHGFL